MYILKYMKIVSMAEARANFAKFIDSAEQTHERVVITRNGEPAAILLGIDDYEGMNDLIDIYSNPETQKRIQEALEYNEAHPEESVTAEEMRRILDERRAREGSDG
jgi:prevent-host-death family protein